jgi:zinc transport system substrate-binding protein
MRLGTKSSGALLLLIAALLVGCGSEGSVSTRINVAASFYPIEFMAHRVGGDLVDVYNPVPPGTEPHDLELTPRTIERIQNSKVFLYLGHGFQPAIDRALDTVTGPSTITKDVSEGVDLLPAAGTEGESTPVEEAAMDPHIWLDPVRAAMMVSNTEQALLQADPANKSIYNLNAEKLRGDLSVLDGEFKQGLAKCTRKELVTSHAAFAYVADRYGLIQVPVSGILPDVEPSPAKINLIIAFAKEHDVKYIFFETLVDPKVAELIASEVGAQTLVLNPIEGLTTDQQKEGSDYFTIMRQNLANLKVALDCK